MRKFSMFLILGAVLLNGASYGVQITYNLSSDFSEIEKTVLQKALNHVADRMYKPEIFDCTRRNYDRWRMRGNFMSKAGIDLKGSTASFHNYFSGTQMAVLRQHHPRVVVKAYSKDDDTTGYAYQDQLVIPEFYTEGFSLVPFPKVTGEFVIYLNKWWLGGSDSIGHDAEYWAGTIAHEMLHNLGHHHLEDEYDEMFIREFENCVATNGTHKKGFGLLPSHKFKN